MSYNDLETTDRADQPTAVEIGPSDPRNARRWPGHVLRVALFLLTYASATYAGLTFMLPPEAAASATDIGSLLANNWQIGLPFSTLLIFFLSAHEFGHYFAARIHGVDASLPIYIPMPFFLFGTLGAVIRTRSPIPTRKVLFDIGIAGPLAGFVVALTYLVIGMARMPGIESLYAVHPEYIGLSELPTNGMHFGGFLLFSLLKNLLVAPGRFFPPMNEIYHYPLLAIGWFGMFVTALNLIPVGQLDGGHILYAMFGKRQAVISRWFFRFMLFAGLGGVGYLLLDATRGYPSDGISRFLQSIFSAPLEWINAHAKWWFMGWPGWLLWVVIIKVFIKVEHPPIPDPEPLDNRRMVLGWIAFAILALTFSYAGIYEMILSAPATPAVVPGTPV